MPRLVSSGPGAPTPTPRISRAGRFAPGRVDGALRQPHQPVQHVGGARLGVRRLGRRGQHGGAVFRHASDDEVGPADVNAQYVSHDAPPRLRRPPRRRRPSRPTAPACSDDGPGTDLRAVGRAGAAGERWVLDDHVARAPRPEPERRHRRPEDGHDRGADRRRQVERRRIVGDQHGRARDERRRRPEPERPRGTVCPAGRRGRHRRGQRRVITAPDDHDGTIERAPPAPRSQATAWCPRSTPAPWRRSRRPTPRSRSHASAAARSSAVSASRTAASRATAGRQRRRAPAAVPLRARQRAAPRAGYTRPPPGCPRSRSARPRRRAGRARPSARTGGADTPARSPEPGAGGRAARDPRGPASAPRLS